MTLRVENFGCRLNALEGDSVEALAKTAGLEKTTIINGCAVTQEALRQARQAARKAKRAGQTVIVTGCAAQTDTESFTAMPEVDRVLGNEEKLQAASYRNSDTAVSDIMQKTVASPLPKAAQSTRARAFVQVQTGCDHRCTFCIIPYGRGNSRSVPVDEVVRRCADLVEAGHQEIVLTGVDITSYGPDIGIGTAGQSGLGLLVRAILNSVPELPRLRLSSIDAVEIDQALLDMVIHEPRLMPHLHLSLQAGDDMILKRMKRRHSRADALTFCEKLKTARPDIAFGADLIAGFPTETDAMFENSRRLIGDCDLSFVHVFPFSPRPNTPAARMPQLDGGLIKQRAANLRETAQSQFRNWLARQHGQTARVLVEKPGEGRAENFARIRLDAKYESGALVDVKINGDDGLMLIGETL
ncbi:MAG: Threonylcarbamoyladenosine tRNA methylthiotransferase MtaB [Alphaproteobacteria bacterium]|nr:MAG: Threonylcarbamoyladenosine tRNA methylthiotransferase MtaB [Alphaproteobacteria bacterium]